MRMLSATNKKINEYKGFKELELPCSLKSEV
jgi:hypothetical protein